MRGHAVVTRQLRFQKLALSKIMQQLIYRADRARVSTLFDLLFTQTKRGMRAVSIDVREQQPVKPNRKIQDCRSSIGHRQAAKPRGYDFKT